MRTATRLISAAMYELSRTIDSNDGVVNAAIAEAALRLDEQTLQILKLKRLLAEGVVGFGRVLEAPTDDLAVREWQGRARKVLNDDHPAG